MAQKIGNPPPTGARPPPPPAPPAQHIEWTDGDGVKHIVSINSARETLARFYEEWPGGWSEFEAERKRTALGNSLLLQAQIALEKVRHRANTVGYGKMSCWHAVKHALEAIRHHREGNPS